MGKAADFVAGHISELQTLSATAGHHGLRDFAVDHGYDNPAGFNAFKKALLAHGLDYNALRQASPAQPQKMSVAALKAAGWTDALIVRFLGEPDEYKDNPHYRAGAPMRLYAANRVQAAESLPEFMQAKMVAANRSRAGLRAAETKRIALREKIEKLSIGVQHYAPEKLLTASIKSYNNWHAGEDYHEPARPSSDPAFLARIQVNFIRHHLTRYDRTLESVAGKVGVDDAVSRIRDKVYEAIAQTYPQFSAECAQQRAARASANFQRGV